MRRHPDEDLGRFRLRDTRSIRRHFEADPAEFEAALADYRAWKGTPNHAYATREARRAAVDGRARAAGAAPDDWVCVLRCAARRLDLGLPCPPWWEDDS